MKAFVRSVIFVAAASGITLASAAGDDLVNCRFKNGNTIAPKICDKLRELDERDRAIKARQEADLQAMRERDKARQEQERAKADERARVDAERMAEKLAKQDALDRKWRAEQEEADRRERADQRRIAAETKSRKDACGDDYGTPKIGMTIDRAQQCVGKFKLVSQLNRPDGVVSTYRTGSTVIHVMGGRIVAWDRF